MSSLELRSGAEIRHREVFVSGSLFWENEGGKESESGGLWEWDKYGLGRGGEGGE